MRYFVITGHKAVTTGDFKLDDIAGGAGRLDILGKYKAIRSKREQKIINKKLVALLRLGT